MLRRRTALRPRHDSLAMSETSSLKFKTAYDEAKSTIAASLDAVKTTYDTINRDLSDEIKACEKDKKELTASLTKANKEIDGLKSTVSGLEISLASSKELAAATQKSRGACPPIRSQPRPRTAANPVHRWIGVIVSIFSTAADDDPPFSSRRLNKARTRTPPSPPRRSRRISTRSSCRRRRTTTRSSSPAPTRRRRRCHHRRHEAGGGGAKGDARADPGDARRGAHQGQGRVFRALQRRRRARPQARRDPRGSRGAEEGERRLGEQTQRLQVEARSRREGRGGDRGDAQRQDLAAQHRAHRREDRGDGLEARGGQVQDGGGEVRATAEDALRDKAAAQEARVLAEKDSKTALEAKAKAEAERLEFQRDAKEEALAAKNAVAATEQANKSLDALAVKHEALSSKYQETSETSKVAIEAGKGKISSLEATIAEREIALATLKDQSADIKRTLTNKLQEETTAHDASKQQFERLKQESYNLYTACTGCMQQLEEYRVALERESQESARLHQALATQKQEAARDALRPSKANMMLPVLHRRLRTADRAPPDLRASPTSRPRTSPSSTPTGSSPGKTPTRDRGENSFAVD